MSKASHTQRKGEKKKKEEKHNIRYTPLSAVGTLRGTRGAVQDRENAPRGSHAANTAYWYSLCPLAFSAWRTPAS